MALQWYPTSAVRLPSFTSYCLFWLVVHFFSVILQTSWETVGKKKSLGKDGTSTESKENKENREKKERESSKGRGGASRRGRGTSRNRPGECGVEISLFFAIQSLFSLVS